MAEAVDVVVIGTGAAGSRVAGKCRSAGWDVAIVDSRPYGGTCALRGCDPKKVLVEAAITVDRLERMRGKGVVGEASIDWEELVAFERSFTEGVPEEREKGFAERGIATLHGEARFTDPGGVEVDGERVQARYIVIATGAKPMDLPFPGADLVATSEDFLDLDRLPERIAFVGGGFISFEFAHVAARSGANATILEMASRVLHPFDPDLVERLVGRSRAIGIDVRTDTEVTAVERDGDGYVVRTRGGNGEEALDVDLVVHGAGRVPDLDGLDLEAGGVERTDEGVDVNGYLQSVSNPAVYAAGDATSAGFPLTPVAAHHGIVVATNLLEGNNVRVDHTGVAAVVFTTPPLAAVGMHEAEARERELDVEVHHADTTSWQSARRVGAEVSAHKVLVDRASDRILGAHLLGPGAEEVVNLFALAIRRGLTAAELKDTRLAYPTHGSDIGHMLG